MIACTWSHTKVTTSATARKDGNILTMGLGLRGKLMLYNSVVNYSKRPNPVEDDFFHSQGFV
jgi:hypothetical protein